MSTPPSSSLPDHVRRAASGACLTVDLGAVQENYRRLGAETQGAEVAACVKADAYGLGLSQVVPALLETGCRIFFVAEPLEGMAVRALAPQADIYVLDGFFSPAAALYRDYALRPVLATRAQIEDWLAFTGEAGALPAGLHFDTGINRLGLSAAETDWLLGDAGTKAALDIRLVMSHLACAEETESPMNAAQLARFQNCRAAFPDARASLCNTAGVFLGPEFHFDIVRPGVGLYGGNPMHGRRESPFLPVAHVAARVLQVREIAKGETVGYGATFTAPAPRRIATLAAGYGDGIFRRVGGDKPQAEVVISGHKAPVVGRVSMDLITADVTALPEEAVQAGMMAEILGTTLTVDHLATAAGTIGYEVLTRLGNRYHRSYKTTKPEAARGAGQAAVSAKDH
ncbi:alanine racemase [Tepidicaulis sp. LMO-SS28]|uniref:alanine racemase n=1 Tax=Tepidicaulis sp. LMO-SS28 TaxID=3447455 RepID=UPI003EE4108B